jgi:hypothetical protein
MADGVINPMRVDTSLLQGITAANQSTVSTAALKSSGTTTSFSSQLKAATEKETTKAVPGQPYSEILTGSRAGMYLNTGGGTRDGEAFVLVKHDGREDHIYGTGDDRKVITVGGGSGSSSGGSSSDTDTDTSTTSDTATADKAPAAEKTKAVDGHAYSDITAGPRKDLYLNTSGNARDGKTFVLVKKDDREYHIYGTGKSRQVFGVKAAAAATSTDSTATTTTPASTSDTATGTTTSGSLVTNNPSS